MKNLKIGLKLVGGLIAVALIALVVGYFGLNGSSRLGSAISVIAEDALRGVASLYEMNAGMAQIDAQENNLLVTGMSPVDRQLAYDPFDPAKRRTDDARKVYDHERTKA